MHFNKHSRRNQTNRNLIIIAVGFLATIMAGSYVFQSYVSQTHNLKYKKLYIEIENNTSFDSLTYTFEIPKDTTFTNTLQTGKQSFQIPTLGIKAKNIIFSVTNGPQIQDSIYVKDSIAYIFIQLNLDSLDKKSINLQLNNSH